MAIFDSLIAEIGSKFGLGAKSGALIAEVIRFMTSEPSGVAGFLDRFKNAGLAGRVSSWLGNKNPDPMSTQQVEQGLGTSIINMRISSASAAASSHRPSAMSFLTSSAC